MSYYEENIMNIQNKWNDYYLLVHGMKSVHQTRLRDITVLATFARLNVMTEELHFTYFKDQLSRLWCGKCDAALGLNKIKSMSDVSQALDWLEDITFQSGEEYGDTSTVNDYQRFIAKLTHNAYAKAQLTMYSTTGVDCQLSGEGGYKASRVVRIQRQLSEYKTAFEQGVKDDLQV